MLFTKIVLFLFARLREPSSHAGIAGVLVAFGQIFPQYAVVLNLLGALFGGNAYLLPETKRGNQDSGGA